MPETALSALQECRAFSRLEIDAGLSGLTAQILGLQLIELSIPDEMRSALPEFKGHVLPDALIADMKYPGVIKRPRMRI